MTARLFGKLPVHGDFVSRGFTRAERDACDAWLSAALADARAAHGEAFGERYDRAPPWRFMGSKAPELTAAALAPSQDSAGRRFPLYADVSPGSLDAAASVEDLLHQAIAGRWTADALAAALDEVFAGEERAYEPAEPRWWLEGADVALAGARPATLLTRMLAIEVPAI